MIRPIQRTILQSVGNILFDSQGEIFDIRISKSGIFELANIETELLSHRLQTGHCQLRVCVSEVDLIVGRTVIAEKKIGN